MTLLRNLSFFSRLLFRYFLSLSFQFASLRLLPFLHFLTLRCFAVRLSPVAFACWSICYSGFPTASLLFYSFCHIRLLVLSLRLALVLFASFVSSRVRYFWSLRFIGLSLFHVALVPLVRSRLLPNAFSVSPHRYCLAPHERKNSM